MISFPISHRVLMKALLCGVILSFTGVGAGGIADDEIDTAVTIATASLQREMNSLEEQLELFEMKHETLQAASEQFRIQSRSAKTKLEAERNRYDILVSEKRSLEMSLESKVAIALDDQKATFEDTIAAEHIEKRYLLAKENEELSKKLRLAEYEVSALEESMKEKSQEQSKRYGISEGKRLASEEKLRAEIAGITERLSYNEKQSKSFEESWKNAVAESEAKDDYFQVESGKRLNEASRWEKRLQKLNNESKDLFEGNRAKEIELIRSRKLHMTLLEKLQASDEAVKQHEAKIESFTAGIEKLSNDLKSASSELTQSKKDHASLVYKFENLSSLQQDTEFILKSVRVEGERNTAKNEKLQNELVDARFELETSQNKTKQTIEEKSEMTKSYTEALEQLTSKNKFLRYELIEIKLELEESKKETEALRKETFEITNAHKKSLDLLDSEGKKLKLLQNEYSSLKKDFEITTDGFNKSEGKVKNLQQRIEKETALNEELQNELLYEELKVENSQKNEKQLGEKNSELQKMYEGIQNTLETSETKLLKTKQQYKKSQEHVKMLQGSLNELEGNVEELIEQLELKVAKNSYLQKSLLDTKYNLEESQSKVKLLEVQMTEISTSKQEHVGVLEIENKKMIERAQVLELELQESSSLYNGVSREINNLRDQLNVTETRSAQILTMYESMSDENDILSSSLRASEEYKSEFRAANLELQEQNESIEQCGNNLRDTQAEYSTLMRDYDAAKERIGETQKKISLQEDAIEELKMRQSELEIIAAQREKDLELTAQREKKVLLQEDAIDELKMSQSELKIIAAQRKKDLEFAAQREKKVSLQEDVIEELKMRQSELEIIAAQHEKDLELAAQREKKVSLQEDVIEELKMRQSELEIIAAQHEKDLEFAAQRETKVLLQEDAIEELKMRQSELEIVAAQREKDLELAAQREKDLEHSKVSEELDTANDFLVDAQPDTSETKLFPTVEEPKGETEEIEKNAKEPQEESRRSFFSFFRWLDYALYKLLRVFVNLAGSLANGLWYMVSSTFIVRLVAPFRSFAAIVSWTLNELRIIHDALVSLFEFEMTFVSSLVSSEKDRTCFLFLIRHSHMFVMFGEAIAFLLCIDFVVSSFLNPIRARKQRPKAKTIDVPKTATASLLRKANM